VQTHPLLAGDGVTVRPGGPADVEALRAILREETVARWWGPPDPAEQIAADLCGDDDAVLLVVEVDGQVAGGVQYHEETEPMYRHAGIDIYLSATFQGRGVGTEAVRLVARFLFEHRAHHRLTIDPAAANERAIRAYAKVGFRPVGIMREYERGADGRFHDGLLMDLLRDELKPEPR
jgi:aminoglycoside 6'-N-acetyltransferase